MQNTEILIHCGPPVSSDPSNWHRQKSTKSHGSTSTSFKRPYIANSSTESTPDNISSNRCLSKVNKNKSSPPPIHSTPSSYRPIVITFSSPSEKSPYRPVSLLLDYWKSKTSLDPDKLNITCRFGYNKQLLVIPHDAYTFDALQIMPFPEQVEKIKIIVKKSSYTSPHHSIVIRDISLGTEFEDVKDDLERSLGNGIVKNIARLYHYSGEPLTINSVDFVASNFVTSMLEFGYVKVLHGRHTVKEYHLPSRVYTCSKCHRHGHPAQECPNKAVCVRCGVAHEGNTNHHLNVATVGGKHFPGQSVCPEIQKIRQERRNRQSYAQAVLSQSRPIIHEKAAIPPQSCSTAIRDSQLDHQVKVYLDERLEEIKKLFLDQVTKVFEQVTIGFLDLKIHSNE